MRPTTVSGIGSSWSSYWAALVLVLALDLTMAMILGTLNNNWNNMFLMDLWIRESGCWSAGIVIELIMVLLWLWLMLWLCIWFVCLVLMLWLCLWWLLLIVMRLWLCIRRLIKMDTLLKNNFTSILETQK